MANVTPNLGINLDSLGKSGLDGQVTETLGKVGTAIGVPLPVRTEGMYALKQSFENAVRLINARLGTTFSFDISGVFGFRLALVALAIAIDLRQGGTPVASFSANPSIAGTPRAGQLVSSLAYTDGTVVNGSLLSRTYLLDTTAVTASYAFQVADVGKTLTIRNGGTGGITATSTGVTILAAPPFTANPTINGGLTVGTPGSFSDGTPPAGWIVTKRELVDDATGTVLAVENV